MVEKKYFDKCVFRLEPPQPPLVEIDDNALQSVSKVRSIKTISSMDKVQVELFKPAFIEDTLNRILTTTFHSEPPQAPLLEIDDNISKPIFKTKTWDTFSIELIRVTGPVFIQEVNYSHKYLLCLEAPQSPPLDIVDSSITKTVAVTKHFNKCSVRGPLFLFLLYPFSGEENLKNKSFLFRLDPPQAPSIDIEDRIVNSISRIKNICETFQNQDFHHVVAVYPFSEDAKYSYCSDYSLKLLKLDSPQPPPLEIEDNILKPSSCLRTFNDFAPSPPTLHLPMEMIMFECETFLFRLEPPQPPQIEIEDTANIIMYIEKRLDSEKYIEQTSSVFHPVDTPEQFIIHENLTISQDLQRPEVDVNDKINKTVTHPRKHFVNSETIFPICTVTIPNIPLTTSTRNDPRRSPPPAPPTELTDKPNSINFCKKNYQEISSTCVQFLQPQSYADILLRKVEILFNLFALALHVNS